MKLLKTTVLAASPWPWPADVGAGRESRLRQGGELRCHQDL